MTTAPAPLTPTRRRSGWTLLLAAVLASVLLAGCTLAPAPDGTGEPAVPTGEEASSAYSSIESAAAHIETTFDRPNGSRTIERDILVRPQSNHVRIEVIGPERLAGNLVVSNGTLVWEYNATTNTVVRQAFSGATRTKVFDRQLAYIFGRLHEDVSSTDSPDVGVSPLPVVPAAAGPGANVSLSNTSIEYGGTATVADRTAHVVYIEGNESRSALRNQTLWLDAETFYPLRVKTVLVSDGERTVVAQRALEADFGVDVPDERFRFDPPANATVRDRGSLDLTVHPTREALARNSSVGVPDPALPDGFAFREGRVVVKRTNGTVVNATGMVFARGLTTVVVAKSDTIEVVDDLRTNESIRAVSIGDRDGYYARAPTSAVIWACDGTEYQVAGGLPKAKLVGIAESMVCE